MEEEKLGTPKYVRLIVKLAFKVTCGYLILQFYKKILFNFFNYIIIIFFSLWYYLVALILILKIIKKYKEEIFDI